MKNDKPVPIEFPKPITVWAYAQNLLQKFGRGVIVYGGAGTPCKYMPAHLFAGIGDAMQEVQLALTLYNPLVEVIIATPVDENSEIYDFQIVGEKHPLAHLKLGLNLTAEL
jgi:hypothetical protein